MDTAIVAAVLFHFVLSIVGVIIVSFIVLAAAFGSSFPYVLALFC